MIAQGIHPSDHGVDKYENCNYAIMRLLIPNVSKLPVINIPDNASPAIVATQESMRCKPAANDPALCYQFPETQAHGGDFGDWKKLCYEIGTTTKGVSYYSVIVGFDNGIINSISSLALKSVNYW